MQDAVSHGKDFGFHSLEDEWILEHCCVENIPEGQRVKAHRSVWVGGIGSNKPLSFYCGEIKANCWAAKGKLMGESQGATKNSEKRVINEGGMCVCAQCPLHPHLYLSRLPQRMGFPRLPPTSCQIFP